MRYEQEKTHMYMVMDAVGPGESVGHEMKMLMNNSFETLLPVSIRNVDNRRSYYYDVTSRQQFGKMYEYRKISRENVDNMINSLVKLVDEIEEYMLETDRIMLNPECIYVDSARDRLLFAYAADNVDEEIEDFRHGLKRLFEYVIEHFDHSLSDADVIYVYNIYQKIAQGDADISNLRELAVREDNEACVQAKKQRDYYDIDEVKLDTVADEIVEDETEVEDKRTAGIITTCKAAAGVVIAIFIGRLLAPSYVPIPVSDVAAFVVVVVSAVIFALLGKIPVHRLTVIKERKEAVPYTYRQEERKEAESYTCRQEERKEAVPYTYRQKERQKPEPADEVNIAGEKKRRIRKNSLFGMNANQANSFGDEIPDGGKFEDGMPKESLTDPYEKSDIYGTDDSESYGATVLLSDYLKQNKNLKMCLRYRGGDDSRIRDADSGYGGADKRGAGEGDGRYGVANGGSRYADGCEGAGTRDIMVEKLPWIIGSMDRHCDTIIRNRLVSHIHACITKVDDDYYIEDMNSTNGTYVNGERLIMNSRRKISESDVITLASISYVVEMSYS